MKLASATFVNAAAKRRVKIILSYHTSTERYGVVIYILVFLDLLAHQSDVTNFMTGHLSILCSKKKRVRHPFLSLSDWGSCSWTQDY